MHRFAVRILKFCPPLARMLAWQPGEICGFHRRVIKIWHVYARTYNFGDHALGIGVRRLWREALRRQGVESIFEIIDTHRFWMDKKDVDMFNMEGGLVLVGGGGVIHCWDGYHWMFHLPLKLLKKLKTPLCVFGVGYNQFKNQGMLPACVRRNIAEIKGCAIGFSVRNDGTKERMTAEGFDVDQVPDPGFFLNGDYSRPINEKYAIMQVAGDGAEVRMRDPQTWYAQYAACADWLISQGLKVIFVPHCELDVEVTEKVIREMQEKNYELTDFWDGVLDETAVRILAYYKHAEFVIGSRGHAQIISYGMSTPFVTFSTHYKQLELSRRLGFGEFASDDPDAFLELCKYAYAERGRIQQAENEGMKVLMQQMRDYMDAIVEKLLASNYKGRPMPRIRRALNVISYIGASWFCLRYLRNSHVAHMECDHVAR